MNSRKKELRILAALAVTTVVVAACGGGSDGPMTPPPPANVAPTVSTIGNQSADQDVVLVVDFSINDESGADALAVTATADGMGLFPADGVVLSGSGSARKLTLTPLEATTGSANVTLSVADPQGLTTTRSFAVTVNAKNASIREKVYETFGKGETDTATDMNGWTAQQDADDPVTFAGLFPQGEE
jgi:predicted small lipoprotein YifL